MARHDGLHGAPPGGGARGRTSAGAPAQARSAPPYLPAPPPCRARSRGRGLLPAPGHRLPRARARPVRGVEGEAPAAGRQHDHPAARAQSLPLARPNAPEEGPRGGDRAPDGVRAPQGAHPGALSERDRAGERRLRGPGGLDPLLRTAGRPAVASAGGDAGRDHSLAPDRQPLDGDARIPVAHGARLPTRLREDVGDRHRGRGVVGHSSFEAGGPARRRFGRGAGWGLPLPPGPRPGIGRSAGTSRTDGRFPGCGAEGLWGATRLQAGVHLPLDGRNLPAGPLSARASSLLPSACSEAIRGDGPHRPSSPPPPWSPPDASLSSRRERSSRSCSSERSRSETSCETRRRGEPRKILRSR